MAHFAELGLDNVVLRVIVVANDVITENGTEKEQLGIDFCSGLYGGTWRQTSYSGSMRKNFAGVGFNYDSTRDAFIAPQPYPSWVLDEGTCRWGAPTAHPEDGKDYYWDEDAVSWVQSSD